MLSYLQLSEGTVVLLDETRLETGQVCFLHAGSHAMYIFTLGNMLVNDITLFSYKLTYKT